ncbi:MmpS family transport accessory protein [Segniliparus rotundus]|nr:MmpS family transport accessory protein [Segniliparus rotundus]
MGKIWLPLIIVSVVILASFAVYRIHGIFGSESVQAKEIKDNTDPVLPKEVTYTITGPAGTHGEVNYVDDRTTPHKAQFTSLPWTLTVTTKLNSMFAQVVAQGDSDHIGCQIVVNGEERDHETVSGYHSNVFCLVKSA